MAATTATRVEPATRRADDASFSGNSEAFLTEAEAFLRSKRFLGPVHGFLADNCPAFANAAVDSECTHEQQEIHNRYVKFVFGLLEAFLQTHQVSQEEFVEACRRGLETGGKGAVVFREIMKADDFLYFKSKMILMWGHLQAKKHGTEPPTPRGMCPDAKVAAQIKK